MTTAPVDHLNSGAEPADPRHPPIHRLIERQAAARPDQPAIVAGRTVLSYRELNGRANALAHHLRALGAAPEVRIGTCLSRSPDAVVSALGIVKSGAAPVLIDPAVPADRVRFMLRDSGARLLVTSAATMAAAPELGAALAAADPRSVLLDRDAPTLARYPAVDPPAVLTPEHTAHVVYTSGSSGRPKGVVARHQTVSHCVRWAQRAFSLSAADRSTWVSAPGFGVSLVNELWPMLATGCTVDLPDEQTLLFPDRLRDWLVNRGITVVQLVGTLAEPLCRQHWPPGCALRLLLATGERQDRWPPADLPFDLVVTYGCTETTHITSWRDDAAGIRIAPDGLPSPPVGRPVADTSVYLLDERGDPVAAGAVGEVYVAGPGLARAYLGDPALTAARWLPDPFAGVAGARMFRTGDLGRLLGDGSLALLGRVDRQVKVRGKRVNLDEVEAAVERQPGVTEAAVVPREHAGDVRLVGYLAGPAADRLPDLYRSLRAQLPDHQVPADLVPADRLPRTPNGKLDRHRLPEPTRDRAGSSARLTAPRGEIELAVADIWCELLDLAEIGTRDDFFELGGHSMIAVKMVSALQQRFGVLIDLPAFYDRPTVAGVAALVSGGVAA